MATWVRPDTTVDMMRHDVATFFKMNPKDLQVVMGGKIINTEGWRTVIGDFNVPALQQKGMGKIVVMPAALGGGKRARDTNKTKNNDVSKDDRFNTTVKTVASQITLTRMEPLAMNDKSIVESIAWFQGMMDDLKMNPGTWLEKCVKKLSADDLEQLSKFTGTRNYDVLVFNIYACIMKDFNTAMKTKESIYKDLVKTGKSIIEAGYIGGFLDENGRFRQELL